MEVTSIAWKKKCKIKIINTGISHAFGRQLKGYNCSSYSLLIAEAKLVYSLYRFSTICPVWGYEGGEDGAMLDEIYQHIDGPIDRGEKVGCVSDVLYPQWPVHFLLLQPGISELVVGS